MKTLLRWTMALLSGCASTAVLLAGGLTSATGVCRTLFIIFAGLLTLTAIGAVARLRPAA